MLKVRYNIGLQLLRRVYHNGAIWFAISNILPPLVTILIGPLVLKKVGLEIFALLGLATYFQGLALAYVDFGCFSHLLAAYSKLSPSRYADFANSTALRAIIWAFIYLFLIAMVILVPRNDELYSLLFISTIALLLPSMNSEWFLIARKRFFSLLLLRIALISLQVILTVFWYNSSWSSPLFIPMISLISGIIVSLLLFRVLTKHEVSIAFAHLRKISVRSIHKLGLRMLPLAMTQWLNPFFLAYSLAWFSFVTPDKSLVGAFSIGYRLALGFAGLAGPFVLFMMPHVAEGKRIPLSISFFASIAAVVIFWILGVPILWYYFQVSKVDSTLFIYTLKTYSILLIAVLFICLRITYVSQTLVLGHYKLYFFIHAISCFPVLAFSWVAGNKLPNFIVPWLACLPDIFASLGFFLYFNFGSRTPIRSN